MIASGHPFSESSSVKTLKVKVFLLFFSWIVCGETIARRFTTFEYVLLPTLLTSTLLLNTASPPETAHWKGGVLFDDAARNLFRSGSGATRQTVSTVSDVLLGGLIAYPFAVDALVDSTISQGSSDTGGQLSLIAAQSFLLTSLARVITKAAVGRERPFQNECAADSTYDPDCGSPFSRTSFFSGHAAVAFTGAGLICSAHEGMSLAGGNFPCYASLGIATVVSLSRVIADKHYLTDSLVGASVGILSGYLLPKLVHYSGSTHVAPRELGLSFYWAL